MNTICGMLLALASMNACGGDRTATSRANSPVAALEPDSASVRRAVSGTRRIPESALESQETAESPPTVDLSGRWLLTLPAGFQYRATIDALGEDRYRLRNAVTFNGIYRLNGDVLQIIEPVDERMNVFDWQLHNTNSITLVDETGASGADYVGATLGRQIDWDTAELPRKIVAIGRPAVPRPRSTARTPAAISRETSIVGTAFHDTKHGPYVETDETIVFITGLDTWPESVLGQLVSVTGTIRPFLIQDGGETLRAQRLHVDSWSPVEEVGPRR